MKRLFVYLSMVYLLAACNRYPSCEEVVKYYRDIDHFELEGLGEIDGPTIYPHYRLTDSCGLRRTLMVAFAPQDSIQLVHRKVGGYWVNVSPYKSPEVEIISYTYMLPHRIVMLSYLDSLHSKMNRAHRFLNVIITTPTTNEEFRITDREDEISIAPSPFVPDSIERSEVTRYRRCHLRLEGGILIEDCTTSPSDTARHMVHCFNPPEGSLQKENLWALKNSATTRPCE